MVNFPLDDFRTIGRELVNLGLLSARGGNLSVRFPNGRTVITRHNSMNGFLQASDFTEIDATGMVRGPEPSIDTPIHLAIYRIRGPGAVIHAHPRAAIALSLLQDVIVPANLEGRYYLTDIPVVPSGIGPEVAEAVAAALKERRVCMVAGHGCYAFGEDLWTALQWVTVLDEATQVNALLALLRGTDTV